MMSLQFLVEMLVTRNYAFAVVFVTSIALLIASGGQRVVEPGALLWARGLDTAIGCGVGLLVCAFFKSRGSPMPIRLRVVLTLATVQTVLEHLASGLRAGARRAAGAARSAAWHLCADGVV